MRVIFDGFWWKEGPKANRVAQREIVFAWRRNFPEDVLALLAPRGSGDIFDAPQGTEIIRSILPLQAIQNGVALPIASKRWAADWTVAHNFAPAWGKSAVFIHDLIFLDHAEWFTRAENAYFRLMRVLATRASKVFTSSRSEADRISRYIKRDVEAVGLAIAPDLANASPIVPDLDLEPKSFSLVVGRLNARKNLGRTIEGAIKSGTLSAASPLVIVGERSGKAADLHPSINQALIDGSVKFAGAISDSELRWLYENAALFLFLSLDEGFGLPCLEAQTFGTPSIVSDIGVFREIMQGNAVFVNPTSTSEIATAVRNHGSRTSGSMAQADRYSWDKTVQSMRAAMTS